jgi:hypothetical protein
MHRPSVENSLVLIVASVKYNWRSEKNIKNCFFHINLRPGAWTSCDKGVLQKLKRHGNDGSCVRFRYVTNHLIRRHYRVCSPAVCILCGINSKHSDILKKKRGGYILKIITKLYVTRNDDTTSFCYKSLKTILVVMMMMIWNILRMLLTLWF